MGGCIGRKEIKNNFGENISVEDNFKINNLLCNEDNLINENAIDKAKIKEKDYLKNIFFAILEENQVKDLKLCYFSHFKLIKDNYSSIDMYKNKKFNFLKGNSSINFEESPYFNIKQSIEKFFENNPTYLTYNGFNFINKPLQFETFDLKLFLRKTENFDEFNLTLKSAIVISFVFKDHEAVLKINDLCQFLNLNLLILPIIIEPVYNKKDAKDKLNLLKLLKLNPNLIYTLDTKYKDEYLNEIISN